MKPLLVALVDQGIDWPAWVQAVGSILAIPVSVGLGIWLQDRERHRSAALALSFQTEALLAIARRCVESMSELNERAISSKLARSSLGYLMEEAEAAEAAAGSVDLMSIRSPVLIQHLAALQQATRTSHRRLRYRAASIRSGERNRSLSFEEPLVKAQGALAGIEQFQSQSSFPTKASRQ